MNGNEQRTRFEIASKELRKLGIILRRLPGEYSVNYRNGGETTARMAEDLDEALEVGRAMAAELAATQTATTKSPRRKWRKTMTPKARRRRFIRAHNRRVRVRALRKQREES